MKVISAIIISFICFGCEPSTYEHTTATDIKIVQSVDGAAACRFTAVFKDTSTVTFKYNDYGYLTNSCAMLREGDWVTIETKGGHYYWKP